MKIWNEYLTLQTREKRELVNITAQVNAAVQKSQIADGIVLVVTQHGNAGVFVNVDDENLRKDIEAWLDTLAPERDGYLYRGQESNAGAHLKNLLAGGQATLALEGGKLVLGPWQQVFYAEFDGQRPKRVLVKILGE